jgi:hypothetical protein
MKRKASALTLGMALLFLVLTGTQFVHFVAANFGVPIAGDPPHLSAPSSPPKISVLSPTNTTYPQRDIVLNFVVTLPESESQVFVSVSYMLDRDVEECYHRDFADGDSVADLPSELDYAITLKQLSEGPHTLRIYASSRSYATYASVWALPDITLETSVAFSFSSALNWSDVNFTVDTIAPKITIHSPLNIVYQQGDAVILNFTANEPTTRLFYTLDGQDNVTIAQNGTLTGLSSGEHSVTVYGWDEAGNVGASETTLFTVAETAPEPFPTAHVATASASVAVVGIGLLVYFKKRKH